MRPRHTRAALVAASVLLVLICSLSATIAASARSGPRRVGSAPVLPRGAHSLGALSSGTEIPVDITLEPSDPAALSAYAQEVSTPGSPEYHQFLTVAQFRQRFAPSDAQIASVRAGLTAAGLSPSAVSANGLLLHVRASAATLSTAFDTSFEQVQLASGRVAYANTNAPQLSGSLSGLVQGVVGLNNLVLPHALGVQAARVVPHARSAATGAAGTAPASTGITDCPSADSLARPTGPYTAQEIASTYGFTGLYAASDEGTGQTVGLLELEPFTRADIRTYNTCYGIDGGSTSDVVTTSISDGSESGASGGQTGEAALDIEQVLGLAPGATVNVFSAPNDAQGVINAYTAMVQDTSVQVISTSWGQCEEAIGSATAEAEETIFEEAATEGQSVFAAAGDDGSTDCDYANSPNADALAVDDPGSDPYVTSVGGTSLPTTDPTSQGVWNDSNGAGGGGVSELWAMPSYQSDASASLGVVGTDSSTSSCAAAAGTTSAYCREVPDVSADADPETGYVINFAGAWQAFGGTSAAAPLWAALTALANASHYCASGPVGFASPVLYGLADLPSAYASDFTDVTETGDNDYTASGYTAGLYPTQTGYDLATGIGSPNAADLVPDMCSQAATIGSGIGSTTTVTQTMTTTDTVTDTVTSTVTNIESVPGPTVTTPGTTVRTPATTVMTPATTVTTAGATHTVTVRTAAVATPKVTLTEPRAGQTTVSVELSCPSGGAACAVTAAMTTAKALKPSLATGRISVAAGRRATLKLSLNAAGRALLRRDKQLKLTLHLTSDGAALATHAVTFTVVKAKAK